MRAYTSKHMLAISKHDVTSSCDSKILCFHKFHATSCPFHVWLGERREGLGPRLLEWNLGIFESM